MQAVFGDPSSPWCAPEYARASAGIQRLLPAFGERAVFTRFVAPAEPEGAWVRVLRAVAVRLWSRMPTRSTR